ncbi:MAG: hypothetical protein EOP89_01365 [Lysobacteraceae bacterium]|nr:MAG: hypothetical protein EOP89_01365 [Xanthomonadaceae bacterium]
MIEAHHLDLVALDAELTERGEHKALVFAIRCAADRGCYALQIGGAIYVVHAFHKKSKTRIATPKAEIDLHAAHGVTGITAADFLRIRNVNLGRFTFDRLISILCRLDQEVEVSVSVRARPQAAQPVALLV